MNRRARERGLPTTVSRPPVGILYRARAALVSWNIFRNSASSCRVQWIHKRSPACRTQRKYGAKLRFSSHRESSRGGNRSRPTRPRSFAPTHGGTRTQHAVVKPATASEDSGKERCKPPSPAHVHSDEHTFSTHLTKLPQRKNEPKQRYAAAAAAAAAFTVNFTGS